MAAPDSSSSFFSKHRIFVIAGAVIVFHVLAIWALQSGLLMRAVELVVPVEVLAQIIEPPKPVIPPPPVIPKETPPPKPEVVKQTPKPPVPQTQAPPPILAVETATPAPNAPAPVQIAPPAPLLPPSVPVAAIASPAPAPVLTPAPALKVLPSTDADDLYNPNQRYPRMSQTLGEQGTVMVRILIGDNGLPKKAELQKTSGFERLDQAALDFVMQSRYKPGTLGGKPTEMWMGREVKYVLRQ
jgi:periplasmic protein TonB